jgi:hypothetical protein
MADDTLLDTAATGMRTSPQRKELALARIQ